MMRTSMTRLGIVLVLLAPGLTLAANIPASIRDDAQQLRQRALAESDAYAIVESLVLEAGPRLAGSKGDEAAVAWALLKLEELGFDNVRAEDVEVPHWERGETLVQSYGAISASTCRDRAGRQFRDRQRRHRGTGADGDQYR